MGRKIKSSIISICLCFVILCLQIIPNIGNIVSAKENFNSTSLSIGTEVDGFIAPIDDFDASAVRITTVEELNAIRNDMYGSYVLMNDLDLSDYKNWEPIGTTVSKAFHGKFDGQGHSITGLTSTKSFDSASLTGVSYTIGLFGVCDGAEIKNIRLIESEISITTTSGYRYDNSAITSDYSVYAGSLVGYACNNTVIYNCYASGNVMAKASSEGYSDSIAGGLIGHSKSSIISYSYNMCNVNAYNGNSVTAYNAYAGGLVGTIDKVSIFDRVYNSGKITAQTADYGNAYAGGLVAAVVAEISEITNSFNEGTVIAQSGNMFCDDAYAGGIVASFIGKINFVYNSGSVSAQVVDPYGIGGGKAYAGGINATSTSGSTISNSAVVQPSIGATSGTKFLYRISNGGQKNNNITSNSMVSGSNVDAVTVTSSDLKTSSPYIDILGWDFNDIWEMVGEKEFPRLKAIKVDSSKYMEDYIAQHLEFIKGSAYANVLNDERWAQTYWSDANTLASDTGEKLYKVVDVAVDLVSLDFGFLFDDGNPYKIILADYVADQTVEEEVSHLYKVQLPSALITMYAKIEKFIRDNWKDSWGELSDTDLFWLFHYRDKTSDEWINQNFEDHISEIVYDTRHSADGIENVLGIAKETFDAILEQKKHLDKTIDWFNGLIDYSANVAAYIQAEEEFQTILEEMCLNLPESTQEEQKYKRQLKEVLRSYTQYNSSEKLGTRVFLNYLADSSVNKIEGVIKKQIKSKVTDWIKDTFSEKALQGLNKIGWAADKTWKIVEYVTKNGELQNCREMLRANAYFEATMYNTLKSFENKFTVDNTIENARMFDAAFKFFKETELYSMEACIAYCETYQSSWVQAIKNYSTNFMNSFIEEIHIHKLYLYRMYCHGMSYALGGKVITVACPTDVYVYDSNGILVASVINNVMIQKNSDVLIYTANTVKLIVVPLDQVYTINVKATDNGSMSYNVSEYDSEMNNVQAVLYSNINISKNEVFNGKISNSLRTKPESYNLISENGRLIDSSEVINQNNNIPVEGIQLFNEKETIKVGETLLLNVKLTPEKATVKTLIWSSSDDAIAEVSEKGVVTGKSNGKVTVTVQSLYGGVSTKIPIMVTGENNKADFNTGIYMDNSGTVLATNTERTIYVNGGNVKQAENIKVNFKVKTYYTKLQASDIVTIDKKGKTKTKKGKLVVGITDSKDVPILTKGKFPKNTSATKIAKASLNKGKIKVTAKSQPGEVYLWVIDTGDAKFSACAKIYVNVAPSTIQLFAQSSNAQDFSSDKKNIYKKDTIELGSSTKLYVYPTYKLNQTKVETKDATYSISVDKKTADCFEVAQDKKDPYCFIVTASAIKNNKITKGKITIKCNQNGKKAVFTATAVNSVQNITVDSMSGLKTDSITPSDSAMIIQASETENIIGSFTLSTINSNDKIMTTDKPKIYLMGSETGFDAIQMAKGKVKITSKPSGEQKKLKAKMERDQKTVTVIAAKKVPVKMDVYCLIVYNTIENKGYKVIKITVA